MAGRLVEYRGATLERLVEDKGLCGKEWKITVEYEGKDWRSTRENGLMT